jgi:hypothetical protein
MILTALAYTDQIFRCDCGDGSKRRQTVSGDAIKGRRGDDAIRVYCDIRSRGEQIADLSEVQQLIGSRIRHDDLIVRCQTRLERQGR